MTKTLYQRYKYNGKFPFMMFNSNKVAQAMFDGTAAEELVETSPEIDYSREYFTIESLEDSNTVTFTKGSSAPVADFSYSSDNGATWVSISTTTSWTINIGGKILFKNTVNPNHYTAANDVKDNGWYFSATKQYDVYGNIMSLVYGDNFTDTSAFTIPERRWLAHLFNGSTTLKNAKNLILPATTLNQYCYSYMFYGCSALINVPELPATTLDQNCYTAMFNRCTSLVNAPELPATTLAKFCYSAMFFNCSSLNKITCLATNISAQNCVYNWVSGVSATGTFIKNPSMSSWPRGNAGIPNGWTVQDYAG